MRFSIRWGPMLLGAALLSVSVRFCAASPSYTLSQPQVFMTGTTSAWVVFTSSVPTTTSIDYHLATGASQTVAETDFSNEHALLLMGLTLGLSYQGTVTTTSQSGEVATIPLAPFMASDVMQDVGFDVAPHVLVIDKSDVIVVFTTTTPSMGQVDYGLKGVLSQEARDGAPENTHALTLMGLTPGAMYTYAVSAIGGDGSIATTAPDTFTVTPLERDYGPGDVNNDGAITVTDAQLALRYLVGLLPLSAQQIAAADIDGNGKLELGDVIRILRIAMGL